MTFEQGQNNIVPFSFVFRFCFHLTKILFYNETTYNMVYIFLVLCGSNTVQWRSRGGGGGGARALERRPWGRTSTLFAII